MSRLQSVERAMNIFELLDSAAPPSGMGVGEISVRMNLKTPTVHNFLKTLLELGYLEQSGNKYLIAEKTRFLGWNGVHKRHLIQIVKPHLFRLVSTLNETCILTAKSGRYWQTLLRLESSHILTASPD